MRRAGAEDVQTHQEGLFWGQGDPEGLSGSELPKIPDLGTETNGIRGGRKHSQHHPRSGADGAGVLAEAILPRRFDRSCRWSGRGSRRHRAALLLVEDFEEESCREEDLMPFLASVSLLILMWYFMVKFVNFSG